MNWTRALLLIVLCFTARVGRAEPGETCEIEVRLEGISCAAANDDPDETDPPRGEFHVNVDTQAEIGPFELKAGESSGFAPGLLLKVIDTGIVKRVGEEMVISISFVIYVREDDTTPTGEDDTDDISVPVKIHARVICPGASMLSRSIPIPPRPDFDEKEQPDRVTLSLRVQAR